MRAHSLHTGPELLRQTSGSDISLAGNTTLKEMTNPVSFTYVLSLWVGSEVSLAGETTIKEMTNPVSLTYVLSLWVGSEVSLAGEMV